MADDAKTPVAIRITRPYGSEDEFLAHELDTLTRTSIVLLGAQQRPQGVVLRFELALASGAPLVRGEGRVVAFKENVLDDLPGLTLRFTRLDSRSKGLVDRAAAMRDTRSRPPPPVAAKHDAPPRPPTAPPRAPTSPPRAPTSPPRAPTSPPARPSRAPVPPPLPQAAMAPLELDLEATRAEAPNAKLHSDRPPPPRSAPHRPTPSRPPTPPLPARVAPAPPPLPTDALDLEATHAEAPKPKRASERPVPSSAPADRDSLLERLRVRRRSLDEDTVTALLAKKP